MAATRTFLQGTDTTNNASTYTFSSVNFGTADAGRYLICCFEARKAGSSTVPTIISASIGGVSASIAVQQGNNASGDQVAAIIVAAVPTGTSGDVVVETSHSFARASIQLYSVAGIDGVTPYDFGDSIATDPTFNLDIPAGGIAIACSAIAINGTTSWTGLTEDYDSVPEAAVNVSSASDEFATTQTGLTITADSTVSTCPVGVFASWGPAAAAATGRKNLLLLGVGA